MIKGDTIAELIKFCEERDLSVVAKGLKESASREKDVLQVLRSALVKEEKKAVKLEIPKSASGRMREPQKKRPPIEFNKEQNEEIMEALMNKIVAKHNFANDPKTNAKIEKLLKVGSF